jgi:predicted DNA-binding ribbon-helix-helix protein
MLVLKWCRSVKSCIEKRSIVNAGRKINISLEKDFWDSLQEIANYRDMTLSSLVTAIGVKGSQRTLSSAIRLFILNFYREQRDRDYRRKAIQPMISGSIRIRTLH